MRISYLAAETLGVRSLATLVEDASCGRVLVDPGAALGPRRFKLPPAPQEEAALEQATKRILEAAAEASRIIITHYHHDHFMPFYEERWIASGPTAAGALYAGKEIWAKDGSSAIKYRQKGRAERFVRDLRQAGLAAPHPADGVSSAQEGLVFSPPVWHGERGAPGGWVIMARIGPRPGGFVFASDTQLLDPDAVAWILAQEPGEALLSGPPLYLPELGEAAAADAALHLQELVTAIPRVVIDHHIWRGGDTDSFLAASRRQAALNRHELLDAATAGGHPRSLLEQQRRELHRSARGTAH